MKHLLLLLLFLSINSYTQNIDSLLQVARTVDNDSIKANTYLNIAQQLNRSEIDSSKYYINKAFNIAKQISNEYLVAKSMISLGNSYRNQTEFIKSENEYHKALKLIKKNHYSDLHTNILNALGVIYIDMERDEKALDYLYQSLEMAKDHKDNTMILKITNNIARLLYRQKRYSESLERFKECYHKSASIGDYQLQRVSLLNIAAVYNVKKNQDSALYYLKKAIVLLKKNNDKLSLSFAYNNLANIYRKLKDYNKALDYYMKALETSRELNITSPNLLCNIGHLYRDKLKDYDNAEKYYLLVENYTGKNKKDIKYRIDAIEGLGGVYFFKKQYEKSFDYLTRKIELSDSVYEVEKKKKITELQIKYETEKKDKEIAIQKSELENKSYKVKTRNYLLAGLLFFLVFLVYTGKVYFSRQKLLQQVKIENEIQEERQRISRDLHDNIGSHLSFMISAAENTLYRPNPDKEYLLNKIREIKNFASNTIDLFRDTIWTLNEDEITLDDFITRLKVFVEKIKLANNQVKININNNISDTYIFNPIQTINIFRTLQEAIQNAIKHSKSDKIDVFFDDVENNSIQIKVIDYGTGFNQNNHNGGYGINNMKRRMRDSKAKIKINSTEGTEIIITVPLKQKILK